MNSSIVRSGIAALALFALLSCSSSSEFKSEPFPDVPDDIKRGPGLFTGKSGDVDVVSLTTGEPQGGDEANTSDFEAWQRSQESATAGDDLVDWLGEDGSTRTGGAAPVGAPRDVTLQGLEKDPEYREYLEYKRWKEYRDFQEWKRQQGQ